MKRKLNKRNLVLLLSLALLLTATVGATLAYVITKTDLLTNLFLPSKVACEVVEQPEGPFTVKNTGDTDAYVRIAVVATWKGTDDTVYAQAPILGADYTLELDSRWVAGSDGFYYYTAKLGENGSTSGITAAESENSSPPDGYTLSVEILASAIQATPDAVQAWSNGVAEVNGDSLDVKAATP